MFTENDMCVCLNYTTRRRVLAQHHRIKALNLLVTVVIGSLSPLIIVVMELQVAL